MPLLPDFTSDGFLPPGDYELTLEEILASSLVVADRDRYPTWSESWRASLVRNLSVLVEQLWQVGITEIFIDGSFVEDKDHPNDIDGYFVCDVQRLMGRQLQRELNAIDLHAVWTWNASTRRPDRACPKPQLPMWH